MRSSHNLIVIAGPTGAGKSELALHVAERFQGEMHWESLEQRLDADHEARVVWSVVEGLEAAWGVVALCWGATRLVTDAVSRGHAGEAGSEPPADLADRPTVPSMRRSLSFAPLIRTT